MESIKALRKNASHHQTPILIPRPSPLALIGAGLGALLGGLLLLMLLLPPACIVGGKGSGAEGGGAGGPRPTTGIPKSSTGSEVRGLKALLAGREGLRERIGGVNVLGVLDFGREEAAGLGKVVSKLPWLALARIWMPMGRLAEGVW